MNEHLNRSGIYQIQNQVNQKVYIGSAVNLRLRKNNHFCHLRNQKGHNQHLQHAFNLYGEEQFAFHVIEYIDDIHRLVEREQYWIQHFEATNPQKGYNTREIAQSNIGFTHSKETKQLISQKKKGVRLSEETKKRMSQSRKGKVIISDKQRKLLSELKKGNQYFLGKQHSEETKQKISQSRIGTKNAAAKLSEEQVKEIKQRIQQGEKDTPLSREYGVSRKCISKIRMGLTWGHVGV